MCSGTYLVFSYRVYDLLLNVSFQLYMYITIIRFYLENADQLAFHLPCCHYRAAWLNIHAMLLANRTRSLVVAVLAALP